MQDLANRPEHEPTRMVFAHRSNAKAKHNTRFGTRYFNHWFKIYRCPRCGAYTDHRRQPIICHGNRITPERKKRGGSY
jgi:hypothetical protein